MFFMPTLPGCYSGQTGQSDVRECLNPVPLVHILLSIFVCYGDVNTDYEWFMGVLFFFLLDSRGQNSILSPYKLLLFVMPGLSRHPVKYRVARSLLRHAGLVPASGEILCRP